MRRAVIAVVVAIALAGCEPVPKSPAAPAPAKWESVSVPVERRAYLLYRTRTPSGWLVWLDTQSDQVIFVPDSDGTWLTAEVDGGR